MWKGLHRLLRRFPHQYEGSGFSVAVQSVGRETVRILYTRGGRSLDLLADCYGGARASIHVRVPKDMSADGVAQMVQDLSEALANLGFGYEIYRTGDPQVVPEEERRRALAELRAMGMDATVQGNTIKTTKLPGFKAPAKEEAAAYGIKMMGLVRTISGHRVPLEVLARAEPPQK